ncbi:hypothetical protein [Geodermatophilus sp. SYSU D00079]
MSRAALRSTLALAAVGGLSTLGLMDAAVAGAAGICASSADGTTVSCAHDDTGGELLFHVPDGVTGLDVAVPGGEAPDAAPTRLDVSPGSTLVIDLGTVEELTALAATDPAARLVPGDGGAALLRVLDLDVDATGTAAGTPTEGPGRAVVVADGLGEGPEPMSIVLTFAAPATGVVLDGLLEPAPTVPSPESGAAAEAQPSEAAPAEDTAAPAEDTAAPAEDAAPAADATPTPSETPAADDVPEPAGTTATEEDPAPEAPLLEAAVGGSGPTETAAAPETPTAAEPSASVDAPAPVETPAPTATAAPTETPVAASTPVPQRTTARASAPIQAATPTGAVAPGEDRYSAVPAADLQTASSMAPSALLNADGVGVLAGSVAGLVTVGLAVTVAVGARRRD